jgi:hypothetical protein
MEQSTNGVAVYLDDILVSGDNTSDQANKSRGTTHTSERQRKIHIEQLHPRYGGKGDNASDHAKHLKALRTRQKGKRLRCRREKGALVQPVAQYLGRMMSHEGIAIGSKVDLRDLAASVYEYLIKVLIGEDTVSKYSNVTVRRTTTSLE